MKYDEWRKLGVLCSDLRTMQIDGFQDHPQPVPGIAFMKPVMGKFNDHDMIERFDCLGYITHDDNRGVWDVEIYNTGQSFMDLEKACLYLWEHYAKPECDLCRYRLIGVDEDGNIVTNVICDDWSEVRQQVKRDLPDDDYADRALSDLSRVGQRFHEFSHGHYAAFPLHD